MKHIKILVPLLLFAVSTGCSVTHGNYKETTIKAGVPIYHSVRVQNADYEFRSVEVFNIPVYEKY